MLDRFSQAKVGEINRLKEQKRTGTFPAPWPGRRLSLERTLKDNGPAAVIAEYKRASPSKGEINLELGPLEVARAYKEGGASALSVLTEEKFFMGSIDYLFTMEPVGLPMLRKDFVLDPLQVEQTAATPASALLLIVRMFPDFAKMKELFLLATDLGLETVFEIFSEQELGLARQAGARLIQVNNRDLSTLDVDLTLSERLIAGRNTGEIWITASGISTPEQVERFRQLEFDGLLVGTSLMGSSDPGKCLQALISRKDGK
jgi:indole-3-glycerol phosphate synthase